MLPSDLPTFSVRVGSLLPIDRLGLIQTKSFQSFFFSVWPIARLLLVFETSNQFRCIFMQFDILRWLSNVYIFIYYLFFINNHLFISFMFGIHLLLFFDVRLVCLVLVFICLPCLLFAHCCQHTRARAHTQYHASYRIFYFNI